MSPQVTTILPIYRLFMSVFKNNLICDQLSCTAVLVVHCRGTLVSSGAGRFRLTAEGGNVIFITLIIMRTLVSLRGLRLLLLLLLFWPLLTLGATSSAQV